jgi:hypothetical protein
MFAKIIVIISGLSIAMAGMIYAAPAEVPKTGQTTCFDTVGSVISCVTSTGQDGEKLRGVSWPTPRFIVTYCDAAGPCTDQSADCDGNASTDIITDKLTGLIWTKVPDSTTRTWQDALTYSHTSTLCGFSDWRMPNILEQESLINAEQATNANWLNTQGPGNPGFSNVQINFYWSSTPAASDSTYAWLVSLGDGRDFYDLKTNKYNVWPVRGGQ